MLANQQYNNAVAVVKSDTINQDGTSQLPGVQPRGCTPFDGLYVAGAGTVTVVFPDGSTCQFTAIAGGILPMRGIRVNATGTAATGIVALYSA